MLLQLNCFKLYYYLNKKKYFITGKVEKPIIKEGANTKTKVDNENIKIGDSNDIIAETDASNDSVEIEAGEKLKANIAGKLASSQERISNEQIIR